MRRSDAVRNRERILEAARACFTEHGSDVPLEEIAAAADITRMSLSRHFPTRQSLAAAIYEENVDLIERKSAELGDRPDAIVELADYVWVMSADNRNLLEYFARIGEASWLARLGERTRLTFEGHLEAAQRAGLLRDGVTGEDFILTISMTRGVDPSVPKVLNRATQFLKQAVFTDAVNEARLV